MMGRNGSNYPGRLLFVRPADTRPEAERRKQNEQQAETAIYWARFVLASSPRYYHFSIKRLASCSRLA